MLSYCTEYLELGIIEWLSKSMGIIFKYSYKTRIHNSRLYVFGRVVS